MEGCVGWEESNCLAVSVCMLAYYVFFVFCGTHLA